ncbi:aminoacyl-tRNA hydrolase [candidate division WWE3 bacterium]|uniref:Peptidyl-tRNA hydrolase n=1 Tax=candidate division WWE3 bacterium TaxID=2053526 RepID=A0A7X9E7P8_UNCKA|nr:aminoacyl-tRNA hydrolase [candidate division WWE3 bacterium]
MKLVVGLGNPGEDHKKNRHNVGYMVLDNYVRSLNLDWENSQKFESDIILQKDFILCKPLTFMNNSGKAVSKILDFYKISPEELIVIHDDVDLPFGLVKRKIGSGSAGHHGVESIIKSIGTKDFWRVRIGVGRPENKNILVENWVLLDFSDKELEIIESLNIDSLLL